MTIAEFPPVETADEHGLLAVGGDLEVDSLLLAYSSGIFPWPFDRHYPAWFSPPERAVLFLKEFDISRSLQKKQKQAPYSFSFDSDFESVIRHCAKSAFRKGQSGTWITPAMIKAYVKLHICGHAHSVEAWDDKGKLAGGLYGVSIGRMFAGESMFYLKPDASKLAFAFLVEHLRGRKVEWIDCQVINPLTKSFGAREIPRKEYLKMLAVVVKSKCRMF